MFLHPTMVQIKQWVGLTYAYIEKQQFIIKKMNMEIYKLQKAVHSDRSTINTQNLKFTNKLSVLRYKISQIKANVDNVVNTLICNFLEHIGVSYDFVISNVMKVACLEQ